MTLRQYFMTYVNIMIILYSQYSIWNKYTITMYSIIYLYAPA